MAQQTVSHFFKYAKSRLGKASMQGVSMYTLVAMALIKDGIQKPEALSDRGFALRFEDRIKTEAAKLNTRPAAAQPYDPRPTYSPRTTEKKRKKRAKLTLKSLVQNSKALNDLVQQRAFAMALKMRKEQIAKKQDRTDFYHSREWRELRYKVFVKYGRQCQCCGTTEGVFHVDHIKPRSLFPELELSIENLQVLCEACNLGKSNRDATDWR